MVGAITDTMAIDNLHLIKLLRLVWLSLDHHFDHHLGLFTEISSSVTVLFFEENWTTEDVLGRAAHVWGASARELNLRNRRFINA
jgi:hypothetical protein